MSGVAGRGRLALKIGGRWEEGIKNRWPLEFGGRWEVDPKTGGTD